MISCVNGERFFRRELFFCSPVLKGRGRALIHAKKCIAVMMMMAMITMIKMMIGHAQFLLQY